MTVNWHGGWSRPGFFSSFPPLELCVCAFGIAGEIFCTFVDTTDAKNMHRESSIVVYKLFGAGCRLKSQLSRYSTFEKKGGGKG